MWGHERIFLGLILTSGMLLTGCIPADGQDRAQAGIRAPRAPQLPTDLVGMVENEPVWTAQQVVADAKPVESTTYIVQPGDTLRGVGNRTGAGSEMLAKANNLTPPYVIRPGQRLIVPGGQYHVVAPGETGIAIAAAYNTRWSEVVAINGLAEPFILRTGQRLLLPGGANAIAPATRSSRNAGTRTAASRAGRAALLDIDIDDVVTGGQPAVDPDARIAAATTVAKPLPTNMPIKEPGAFAGRFAWPIEGTLLSRFGPGASGIVNEGVDIRAAKGTPIMAAADGVVAYAGDEIGVYGGLVLIVHGSGWVTAYGHADRVDVVRGQKVKAGQIIALSGDSGRHVERPQLHFEIRRNRQPVNPLTYLPPRS